MTGKGPGPAPGKGTFPPETPAIMMEEDRDRRRRNREVATALWVILIILLILALIGVILGCIALANINSLKSDTALISSVESDNPWFPCENRVTMEYQNTHWTTNTQKVDGAACNDVCLNASLPATCEHGVCTGTCAGESEEYFEFGVGDCPDIVLADVVDLAGLFRVSFSFFGKCIYMIFDLEEIPPNGIGGLFQVFLASGEAERRLSKNARGLIGDSDLGKIGGCYDVSYFPAHLSPIDSAIAIITFDCARYMYEGVDRDNITLSLMRPLSDSASTIMPKDYSRDQSVLEYVWSHRNDIRQRQIGVTGSFPKIQWKP